MIKSLLIANRGEIACRIMATCRELGIRTIAVYSDADRSVKHVREADEAYRIGPPPAAESYLNQQAILGVAKEAGADAIHPGYGFLSENAGFAKAVLDAGLVWVGPRPQTIDAMGLKDEAKRIAEEAGVPVLPGYRGEDQSLETLKDHAGKIGFPLLIKAVAGGGGRGIREVRSLDDLAPQLESAQREAKSAFGDERVMLEKLVEQPRHIEVQVFGDAHGNVVHLFERDCSLQRRRQKVIEEAPAPGMPATVREAMTGAAVKLAAAVGYEGAGTVEFIVDGSRPLAPDTFWFLEMNTRLQVEHPVTELITGQDLVAWQLRVASGEALPAAQTDLAINGHAIETRICAEDPSEDFSPGFGRIEFFEIGLGTRLDTGFEAGDLVPPDYDSMISKLISHGETREAAVEELHSALCFTGLFPIKSNLGFLARCVSNRAFLAGQHHVNWIAEQGDELTQPPEHFELIAMRSVANAYMDADQEPLSDPWAHSDGWRVAGLAQTRFRFEVDGTPHDFEWSPAEFEGDEGSVVSLGKDRFGVIVSGEQFVVSEPSFDALVEALEAGDDINAPMPGKLLSVKVKAGDMVTKDQPLAVMEAMKMEHTLSAPRDGEIAEVSDRIGEQVGEGDLLVRFVPDS